MKKATMLLAAMMAVGATAIVMTGSTAEAKKSSSQNQNSSSGLIHKGMTLEEAQLAANAPATPVGGPNNGVQTYRIVYRQNTGDGTTNDHPTITFYMFGVKNDKVTWVHKTV